MSKRNCREVALKQWISGAVDESTDAAHPFDSNCSNHTDPRTMAISSDAFLLPALKVAKSLAEQMMTFRRDSTALGSNFWADHIAVYLSPDSSAINGCCDDVVQELHGNLPELTAAQPRDDEVLDALKLFSEEEEGEDQLIFIDEKKLEERCREKIHYLRVEGAKNLSVSSSDIIARHDEHGREKQHIYSLGLVLYEIFSGGKRTWHAENLPLVMIKQFQDCRDRDDENHPDIYADDEEYGKKTPSLCDRNPSVDLINQNILDGFDNVDRKEEEDTTKEQNSKKKKTQMKLVSVEPLKSKGVPTKLCDLIANMIGCALGDLSGDQSYSHIRDVCADLQLMLDEPSKFLHDVDIVNTSNASLRLNETEFGREEALTALKDSYQRSILFGGSELAIISGSSGTGKSVLAQRLGRFIASSGAIFLQGKFDHLEQSRPFSALAAIFNSYCDIMMARQGGNNHAEEVTFRLKLILGAEVHHLARLIPNLSSLLGLCSLEDEHHHQACVNGQKRLLYLLCQFVDIISTYSGSPIVLFFDDLQWADQSSIAVVRQLFLTPAYLNESKRLFFLGCCREEGLLEGHPLGTMLSEVRGLGVHITDVPLQCMDKDTINTIMSNMLCLSPRVTRPLAHSLFHQTKGNQLFFSQLMTSLEKEGLLWLSLAHRRWEWDLEKVSSRELPQNVAAFFAATIGKLETEVQTALTLLSCFGARSECSLVENLQSLLRLQLVAPLEIAISEGLLNKVDGKYSFTHDRVQEAAYNRMAVEDRCLCHFKYGIALASSALEHNDDDILFTAVSQINRGGPNAAINDAGKRLLIAKLNLKIGKSAVDMSDFSSGYSFFDHGITFLQKGHWKEHYVLSFQLFEAAVKCALVIGDLAGLNVLSEQVLKFAKSFDERLPVLYATTCALAYANKLPECIEKASSVLSQLGEELPTECFSSEATRLMIQQTESLTHGFTDKDLLEYRLMKDERKIMAMRFYALLETATQHAKPDLQPIITLKMMQLSVAYGMSPMSPVALTYFGMLIARLGNLREGYRYVKLARTLLNRVGSERAGEVIFVGTQIRCFVEPLQATYELHLEGYQQSMAAGDISSALSNMICYTVGSFEAGINLQLVKKNCEKTRHLMEQHTHLAFLIALVTVQRSIMGVIGEDMDSKWESLSPYSSLLDFLNNMYLHFTFREFDKLKTNAEKYFACNYHVKSWSLLYSHATHESIAGLASFWIYRKSNDLTWLDRGIEAKERYKNWYSAGSNINFESRFYLLEAEEYWAMEDFGNAKSSYEKAISSARKHRSISDEAYACELAGYFLLEQAPLGACIPFFVTAQQKFHDWGALKKAKALEPLMKLHMGC